MASPLKVLILEDNQNDALLMVHELEEAGYDLDWECVEKEKDYIKGIAKHPDLILADFALPQFDALEALKSLKDQSLDIPLIVVTGSISEETAVRCIKAGAADYLIKDRLARLGNAVQQALDDKHLREEKQTAERALKQSEKRYRELFEGVPVGLYRSTPDGGILDINNALVDIFGYPDKEMLINAGAAASYLDPTDYKKWQKEIEKMDTALNYVHQLRRYDGSLFWAEESTRVFRDENGNVSFYEGNVVDITERIDRQHELETIVTVDAALRTAPNITAMLPIILDLFQDISNAKGTALALFNSARNELLIEAANGVWDDWKENRRLPEEEISGEVFNNGKMVSFENVQESSRFQTLEIFKGLTAFACIPLIIRKQVIGTLWIGSDEAIGEQTLDLILVVSNIAANAIHRTTLYENNIRVLLESRAISSIGRNLNENLDLEKIFQLIVNATTDIIPNSNRAIIHLFNEKNMRLHPVAISYANKKGAPKINFPKMQVTPHGEFDFDVLGEIDKRAAHMSRGKGIAGRVIDEGIIINVKDTLSDSRYLQAASNTDIRSMVVVPIQNPTKRLGTISVLSSEPFTFTTADEDLLENLCIQATTAIENARRLEAERLQREMAEALAEISALINKSLELGEVLDQILDHTLRVFSVKAANILLIEGDNLKLAGHKGYAASNEDMEKYNRSIPDLSKEDLIGIMYRNGERIIISDTATHPRWNPEMSFEWVRSYAGIPLKVGDEIIGFLIVDSDKPNFMTDDVVQRLEIFANDAATAVQNARLYSDLETSLETEKATRSQLIRADKLAGMGRMVASVAHELNNPLQTIKNCLFLINQNHDTPEEAELLELSMSEVERLSSIVSRLRDVYRPRPDEKFQPTPIAPLLADVAILLETHLRRNKVTWEKEPGEADLATVNGFPDKLKQVFLNLSLNSIEAMRPDGGTLTVKTMFSEDEKHIGIAFSDTGHGISEGALKFVFDPFYTTKETGMGLGLSICYDITQNHNGHISVKNNPDKGATFTVWLPLIEIKEKKPTPGD